ncbi:hypothetical protein ACTOVL_06240 [Arcanobacterium canis]
MSTFTTRLIIASLSVSIGLSTVGTAQAALLPNIATPSNHYSD